MLLLLLFVDLEGGTSSGVGGPAGVAFGQRKRHGEHMMSPMCEKQ